MTSDAISICAAGESAWHATAYAGLHATWTTTDGIAYGATPHRFLLGAVTLQPRPALPPGIHGIVRDSWAVLSEADLPGWSPSPADPWMLREAGPCAPPSVADVDIERTDYALLFERTAFLAASGRAPTAPGELHPAGSAGLPGLHLFLARRGDRLIGTALAVVHAAGVTVSAVAVLATERRRGVGAALTATACSVAPDLPATLTASVLGTGPYRTLGFVEVGRGLDWSRPVLSGTTPST